MIIILHQNGIVSIQLISLASREKGQKHRVALEVWVSIQLISLASREKSIKRVADRESAVFPFN